MIVPTSMVVLKILTILLFSQKILTDLNDHPFAIAVFEDKIYWSGWTNQEIVECNKFTGKNRVQVVKSRKDKIYGVHIFHPTLQNHSVSKIFL